MPEARVIQMRRKPLAIGPSALRVIEDAPLDLCLAVIAHQDGENEPALDLLTPVTNPDDRTGIIQGLSRFDREELRPLEERCQRILKLAEGRGVASLDTIVDECLGEEEASLYAAQPDPLCRSIWTYLNFLEVFEDAESFHVARQFRDYGKLYDALEVDLEAALLINASSVNEAALALKMTEILELKTNCSVRAVNLPAAEKHPASIMLVVRHGGPLSSVHDHRKDGRRGTIYFRPSNEAILIYTPTTKQIEICAESADVRQKVSRCFAETVLGQDVSRKPLTWKHYDLSRFAESLALDLPEIAGFTILLAKVLETEVRLGGWSRRLSLKVTVDDEIDEVASRYLGASSVFARADGFSRISIAVRYHASGETHEQTLNITIAGGKSCNLPSNKDPKQRRLGFALLESWGVLHTLRQMNAAEVRRLFPKLIQLFDRAEKDVSGALLQHLGLEPTLLIERGLIERRGRQDIFLDDAGEEARVSPSSTPGMVSATGAFGESLGEHSATDFDLYRLNAEWLRETVLALLKPLLTTRSINVIDDDLMLLGAMRIDDANVPVYFARRLDNGKNVNRIDLLLRGRSTSGFGIVFSASREMPSCLGPNVVLSVLSHLSDNDDEPVLSREGIELAFRSGRNFAIGGAAPIVLRRSAQTATLHIPGKPPMPLIAANQIQFFERLVAAYNVGSPDMKAGALLEGTGCRSPQQAFRRDRWLSMLGVYITKGVRRGYWRLAA
jgi:hypothetical protein